MLRTRPIGCNWPMSLCLLLREHKSLWNLHVRNRSVSAEISNADSTIMQKREAAELKKSAEQFMLLYFRA